MEDNTDSKDNGDIKGITAQNILEEKVKEKPAIEVKKEKVPFTKKIYNLYDKEYKKLAPKTHDVLFLAGEVNLPDKFISKIESLTDIYMETRYPDIEETIKLKEKDVSNFIKATKEVLKWCKKQI